MRPLDRVGSIKVKLSLVIVAAVGISAVVSSIGFRTGIPVWVRPIIAVVIALALVYPFSRGVTSPLREMAAASRAMADGDYSHPITSSSRDEVGELARAFDSMRRQLADVDRQRRDLVANVAHELRTPLAGIRARFENIADGIEVADADAIACTLAEVERLSRLLDQLLDLNRIESGAAPLEYVEFEIEDMLREVAEEAVAHGRGAIVHVRAEPTLVVADEFKLRQVVANLLQNAIRYSPRHQPVVITADSDGAAVTFAVIDNGPGIPEGDRERVLERFYRSDHGRASESGGAGLGLAIASSIVDLHGGTIEISANEPSGCRVEVSIPLRRKVPRA